MSRRLAKLAILLTLGWLAVWGMAAILVPRLADTLLANWLPRLERTGLAVDSLSHDEVRLAPSLLRASAGRVSAAFDLAPTDDIRLRSTFEARRVSVRLTDPLRLRGRLEVEGFEVAFHETDRPRRFPFDRLTDGELAIDALPLLAPRQALREIRKGLERLIVDNAVVGDFELHGNALLQVQGRSLPARLYTDREGDRSRLRFDESDLRSLVAEGGVDLSPEQVAIVSLYPARIPLLIDITRRARSLAWSIYPQDRYQRDALRHVAWSYFLTQEFGAQFAKEVTDAQETKPGNTANERAMDYHNNAVGRRLASTGTPPRDLPELVGSHPDVIRHPSEVDSRQELWR